MQRRRISNTRQTLRANETERHFASLNPDSRWAGLSLGISLIISTTSHLASTSNVESFQDRYLSDLVRSLCGLHDSRLSAVCLVRIPSNSHQLQHLAPETDRRVDERGFVSVNRGPLPYQIGLGGLDELGAMEELPEGEGCEG